MIKYSSRNYCDLNKEIEEFVDHLQKDLIEMKNTMEKNKQLIITTRLFRQQKSSAKNF